MSRTIDNSDDVIDSRDVIERIEELQALRKPWVAGWNMPGYMPDSEPCGFETCAEACDYIASEMRRAIDDAATATEHWLAGKDAEDAATNHDALEDAAKRWDSIADDEQEHGETIGNYHYWVAKCDGAEAFEDASDYEELKALEALASEAEGYSDDWTYGSTLIRDSYFTDYARELLEDCGDLPRNMPSYIEIDWEATARNIRSDYTSVEFDGVTYWVR